jgi:putative redox protein
MSDESIRVVDIERTSAGHFAVRNARGGVLHIGADESSFNPVELFLAALGACTALDVDVATSRRAEPSVFRVRVTGDKIKDDAGGNLMENLEVGFTVVFPDGESGDAARAVLARSVRISHDRLCTVSRTVERGTPVAVAVASPPA